MLAAVLQRYCAVVDGRETVLTELLPMDPRFPIALLVVAIIVLVAGLLARRPQ